MTAPRAFSHIGLSVPDLDAAVKFYTNVLGFYTIMEPTEVTEDDSDIGQMCTDVFGVGWTRLRIAHLATADRIGFELFEFDGNSAPADSLSFRQHGMFHFAIQDPDLEGLLAKILAAGGKQRMPVREYFPDKNPTGWSMSRTRSASYSRSTATAMNSPTRQARTRERSGRRGLAAPGPPAINRQDLHNSSAKRPATLPVNTSNSSRSYKYESRNPIRL